MHNSHFVKYSSKCSESLILPYDRIMGKFVLGYIKMCLENTCDTCDYEKAFDYGKCYLYWKIYGCVWDTHVQNVLDDVDYFIKKGRRPLLGM